MSGLFKHCWRLGKHPECSSSTPTAQADTAKRRHRHDQRPRTLVKHVELQRPRQKLGSRLRTSTPTRLPLATRQLRQPATRLPTAQELGETSLMFLVHPTLTDAHSQQTCEALRNVMQQATIPSAESWSQTIIAEREDRV